jgi:ribose transport system permease protein
VSSSTPGTKSDDTQIEGPAPSPSRQKALESVRNRAKSLSGPLGGLLIMVIALSFLSPFFLTARNLSNIASQISDLGIMAAGAALVILIGGIDLSVAANMALSMMVTAWLYKIQGVPFVLTLIIGLLVAAFVGLLNGVLSTYGRVQPFVATLATMSIAAGLALYITKGNTINGFPTWFGDLTALDIFGIPLQAILLVAIYLVLAFWLRFRPGGRALYAIGGNEEVARLSGLPVRMAKTRVYIIAGALAAVAGWINISRLDSAQPTAGAGYLLNVIAVVVIGGASLAGGVMSMGNTFVGLLIIGVLNNGLSLLHVNPNLQAVVIGVVILAAVLTDRAGIRKRG